MTISKLKYTTIEETSIQVTMDDGSSYSAPWPCYTWHSQEIQSAIDSGLKIEPYKTSEELLNYARETVWSNIKAMREDRAINGGVKVLVDGRDKWFYTDLKSTTQYNTIANTTIGSPDFAIPNWKTMDGSFVTMTPELVNKILLAGIIQQSQTYANAEVHKASMLRSEEPIMYDYSTGWPKIFGE